MLVFKDIVMFLLICLFIQRTRHAGHCRRTKDELISDVLLWTPTYSQAKAGRPARIYIQQLCEDTGCNPEDLPEAMNNREKWRERIRDIRTGGTTWWWSWWWWWWWWWFIQLFVIFTVIYTALCHFHGNFFNFQICRLPSSTWNV